MAATTLLACGHESERPAPSREHIEGITLRFLDQLEQAQVTLGQLPAVEDHLAERVVLERDRGEPLGGRWVTIDSQGRTPQVEPEGELLLLNETLCTIISVDPQQTLRLNAEMASDRRSDPPSQGHRIIGQPVVVELDERPPSIGSGCQIDFLVSHSLMPRQSSAAPRPEGGPTENHEISFTTMSQTRAVAIVLATELQMSFSPLGTQVIQHPGSTARIGSVRVSRLGVNGISHQRFRELSPPDPLLPDDPHQLRVKPSLGRILKDAALAPLGTNLCWNIEVPERSSLRFALGVAWHLSTEGRRPVRFSIRAGGGEIFEEIRRPEQRGWVERLVPLTGLRGEQEICFVTSETRPSGTTPDVTPDAGSICEGSGCNVSDAGSVGDEHDGTTWALWGMPELTAPRHLSEDERPRTIVLISIDTLRADRLGHYGYDHSTSPVLDQLASRSMVYENHVAQTGWTLPSHVSMLTGLSPEAHGVTGQMDRILDLIDVGFDPNVPTLAAALREAGYSTHAIVSAPYLDPAFGFDRGFDSYDASVASSHLESHQVVTAPQLSRLARRTIGAAGGRPMFLFLHFWDVHYDYIPPYEDLIAVHGDRRGQEINYDEARHPFTRNIDPALLRLVLTAGMNRPPPDEFYRRIRRLLPTYPRVQSFLQLLSDLYDGEIRTVDRHLGLFFEELRRRGREDSVIIMTGDHGESFMEHGTLAHGVDNIHSEGLIVPLIIHAPGRLQPGREQRPSATADIASTLLDLLGLERLRDSQGHSLLDPPSESSDLVIGHDGTFDRLQATRGNHRLLVWGYFGNDELFDISEDPEELVDVSDGHPARLRELRRDVALYLLEHGRGVHVAVIGDDRREEFEIGLESDVPLRPAFAYGPPNRGAVSYGQELAGTNQNEIDLRASPGAGEIVALTVLAPNEVEVRISVRRGTRPVPAELVLGPDGSPLASSVSDSTWNLPIDSLPEALSERSGAVVVWRTPAYSVRTPLSPGQETLEQLRALGYIR